MADEIGARLLSGDPVTAAQHEGGQRRVSVLIDWSTDRPVVPTRPASRRPSGARRGRSAGAGRPAVRARRCPAPDGRPAPARLPSPHTARAGSPARDDGAALTLRRGRPEEVVPAVVAETGAAAVHISADFAPYGAQRDQRVAAALGDVPLVATGSPYAVAPDRIRKPNGDPYQVFAAFYRSWVASGWDAPARFDPSAVDWRTIAGEAIPDDPPITCHIAGRRRDRRTPSVGTVPRRRSGGLRRPPRPPGPRRHLAHVAVPQTRRDPPAHAASRSRTR